MPLEHYAQSLRRKAFTSDVSVTAGERAVVAKISTSAVDRDGEVLVPHGADVREFEANPVVYLAHDYFTLPVGKVTGFQRTDRALIAKTVFAERPASHPVGAEWIPDTLLSLYQQGVLRGFSVGMIPLEARPANPSDVAKYGVGVKRVFNKWKLLELSVAPLPANQEALALAVSKGLITRSTASNVFGFQTALRRKLLLLTLNTETEVTRAHSQV